MPDRIYARRSAPGAWARHGVVLISYGAAQLPLDSLAASFHALFPADPPQLPRFFRSPAVARMGDPPLASFLKFPFYLETHRRTAICAVANRGHKHRWQGPKTAVLRVEGKTKSTRRQVREIARDTSQSARRRKASRTVDQGAYFRPFHVRRARTAWHGAKHELIVPASNRGREGLRLNTRARTQKQRGFPCAALQRRKPQGRGAPRVSRRRASLRRPWPHFTANRSDAAVAQRHAVRAGP